MRDAAVTFLRAYAPHVRRFLVFVCGPERRAEVRRVSRF